jgi:Domain of unknown function (DUF1707)
MNDDHLRISDEERERAAAELGEHYAHGRLDRAEHAERLDRVWAARTRGELPPIFRDLPGTGYGRGPAFPPFGTFPARPGAPAPWVGAPVARRQRGLPGPVLAVLGVLVVVTVLTHMPFIIMGLLVWLLLSRTGRRSRSRWEWHGGGHGSGNPPWGHPGR